MRADDLIHPELAPGLPVFMPSFPSRIEGGSRRGSSKRCAADRTARGRLLYGVALQRLGRPVSARRAFAEALTLAPNDVDALVADAVGRYDKSDLAASFSRLGPLTRRFPQAATVRFHLGVLLLWQQRRAGGETAAAAGSGGEPGSRIAREAGRYLDELAEVGTG